MVLRLTAAATRGFTAVSFTETVSRRNTFVGGTCAPPSARLVFVCTLHCRYLSVQRLNFRNVVSFHLSIFIVHQGGLISKTFPTSGLK